jgi:hypothetical protein
LGSRCLAAGHKANDEWRYGGSLMIALSDLSLLGTISDRLVDPTRIRTVLLNGRRSGTAYQLRFLGGLQYDGISNVRLGAMIRTPALSMKRSGFISADGLVQNGASSTGLSLFDSDASFDLRLPWEFHGGVAYIRKRGQVEFDVQGYTPVSQYTLLGTSQPYAIYRDPGTGAPPTIETHLTRRSRAPTWCSTR